MDPGERPLNASPQENANCCSKATFWWTNRLFQVGNQRHLEDLDLYDVLPEDSSIKLANDLGREWEKELYKWKTGGKPSLYSALYRCYGCRVVTMGMVFFLVEGLRIGQALLLGQIITYFEAGSSLLWQHAYIYSAAWTVCYVLVIILDNLAFHKTYYFGMKMRVAATSLIYRKLLRLSYHSLQAVTSNTIVNLLSADTPKFNQSCLGVNYIWIAPIETIGVVLLLWLYLDLGATCLIGLAVLIILTPIQFLIGGFLARLRSQMNQLTDRRVRIMSEVITGIRDIKTNSWEKPFAILINAIRKSEWTYIRVMNHIRSINSALYFVSGKLLMFATFVTYTLLGGQSGASTIFTALALFEILRGSVSLLLPWGIQHYIEVKSAILRIQDYMLLEEKGLVDVPSQSTEDNSLVKRSPLPENTVVRFEDFSAAWGKDEESFSLDNLNFSVQKGQYMVITGSPSSGKSSLLLAVAGELPRLGGFVRAKGKLGLVTQKPWLFPGTIRENILFGADMERRRYNKVLHACGLLEDVEAFENADLSAIGEKGVNLTVAQKSKICLARAVYQNCDVYLIDDIFNNMEEKSAVHIFTKCFCGIISSRTIVLVTNSLKFIRAADTILVLDKGKVSHKGSYDHIQKKGIEMEKLLLTYQYHQHHIQDDKSGSEESEGGPLQCDISASQTSIVRQRSGLDSSYGSSESLDQIWLEYDNGSSDTDSSDEDRDSASVSWGIYFRYLRLGKGFCVAIIFFLLCVLAQAAYILCDWWLYIWITDQTMAKDNMTSLTTAPSPVPYIFPFSPEPVTAVLDFYIYLALFGALLLLGFLKTSLFSMMAVSASQILHNKMFSSVMRAPSEFFNKTTSGRVLSRFARDTGCVDDPLPANFFECIQFLFLVGGASVLTAVANYWLVLVIIPVMIAFICVRYYFVKTAREVKRLEMSAKSPLHQHLSNTLEGMWTIRAFDTEERFLRHFDTHQDRHTSASYTYLAIQRWFALRLDAISVIFVGLLAFVSVAVKDNVEPGLIGMALAYSVNLMALFQYSLKQSTELEHQMSGVDRILKFADVTPEGDLITINRPAPSWPQYGIVTFEGYSVLGDDGNKYLKNLWGCIRAEEKVGVLSRVEASKQALVSAILRLKQPHSGILRLDGLDISEIGLQDIRERITLVSQDPMLFSGSLRRNLDPFTRYPDASVWKVLEEVSLKEKVDNIPGKLYADMAEYGQNFSQGEKQLLGLARALLQSSKIVIFEEASSILERHTELMIQNVINTKFIQKTVIVIAQRLHTIISLDRVMVLDDGKIKEFDSPHQLLQNNCGLFYRLVSLLSDQEIDHLRQLAEDKHENRPYHPPPQSQGGQEVPSSGKTVKHFLPSFQSTRLTGVLSHFSGNRFSTNRF